MSWVWNRHKARPSKADWNAPVLPAGADRLQYLYDWERRCRGYDLYPYPVALEPPFLPFAGADMGSFHTAPIPSAPGAAGGHGHVSLRPPVEQRVSAAGSQKLLQSWLGLGRQLAFEVVADEREIAYSVCCGAYESEEVAASLAMHFSKGQFGAEEDRLLGRLTPLWRASRNPSAGSPSALGFQCVEFGLQNFAFQTLQCFTTFEADPHSALVSSLAQLRAGEVAGLQVLLAPARGAWAASLQSLAAEFDTGERIFGESAPKWRARQKTGSPLFAVVIRVFAASLGKSGGDPANARAFALCQRIGAALGAVNDPSSNSLMALSNDGYPTADQFRNLLQRQTHRSGMLLSAGELAGLVHPPTETLAHPKLLRFDPRERPLPEHLQEGWGATIGLYTNRNEKHPVAWPDDFRNRHAYLLGATRMGKSTMLLNLIDQDVKAGKGLCLIDPHGDLAQDVLQRLPAGRAEDALYIDFVDTDYPVAIGLLEARDDWERRLLVSDVLSVLHRLFASSWGDRLEHILRHVLLTLLCEPGHSLRDIRPLLSNKEYRAEVLQSVRDPELRAFWHGEFHGYSASTFSPIYNKLGLLLSSPLVRNIVAQKESRLDFSRIIAEKKILIVNLNANLIGMDNAHFLGALLVSKIQIAAMQALRLGRTERTPFTLYTDEFQNFVVSSFEKILSEAGKAGLSLVMANQFLEQLNPALQTAILSNVGAMVSFRVSADSGRMLEKEFAGLATQKELVSLNRGEAVARLGSAADSFRIETLPPPALPRFSYAAEIRDRTRLTSCREREEVEEELESDRNIPDVSDATPARQTKATKSKKAASDTDIDDGEEPQAPIKKPSPKGGRKVTAAPKKNVKISALSEPHSAAKPASPIDSDLDTDLIDDYDSLVEYDDVEVVDVDDLGSHDSRDEESVQHSTSSRTNSQNSWAAPKPPTANYYRPSLSGLPSSDSEMPAKPTEPLLEPLTFGLQVDPMMPGDNLTDSSNQTTDEERPI